VDGAGLGDGAGSGGPGAGGAGAGIGDGTGDGGAGGAAVGGPGVTVADSPIRTSTGGAGPLSEPPTREEAIPNNAKITPIAAATASSGPRIADLIAPIVPNAIWARDESYMRKSSCSSFGWLVG
jgi:hypothetical protein